MNETITHPEVRLVLDDGTQFGIVNTAEALRMAVAKGLDLVEMSANAKPPVCRIMDYGKYKFEKSKKDKEAQRRHRASIVETKEIKFRMNIDSNDYQVKLKKIRQFLGDGDKVKVVIMYRGREIAFQQKGLELLKRVQDDVKDLGLSDKAPERMGRQQLIIISPI